MFCIKNIFLLRHRFDKSSFFNENDADNNKYELFSKMNGV